MSMASGEHPTPPVQSAHCSLCSVKVLGLAAACCHTWLEQQTAAWALRSPTHGGAPRARRSRRALWAPSVPRGKNPSEAMSLIFLWPQSHAQTKVIILKKACLVCSEEASHAFSPCYHKTETS